MTKTISIDKEAYDILKSHKVENQSFSQVIKNNMAHTRDVAGLKRLFGWPQSKKKTRKKHAPAR